MASKQVTTKHFPLDREVYVISETEVTKDSYFNVSKATISSVSIDFNGVTYMLDGEFDLPETCVFPTRDTAIEEVVVRIKTKI
mgnify:CR=1 FL=1|tara:strand:- start:1620 stop:1868 length:249 start_codon:yes stop_codon:yes gene_type:complete